MERLLRALWSPPGDYSNGVKTAVPPWGYNTCETDDRAATGRVTGNRHAALKASSAREPGMTARHHASSGAFHKATIQATEA